MKKFTETPESNPRKLGYKHGGREFSRWRKAAT